MGKATCEACKKRCKGQAIKLSDTRYFHVNCFTCSECQKQLHANAFFVRNNHRYCAEDFQRLFSTKCHLCLKVIEGDVLTVAGHTYHHNCIMCSKCRKNVEAGNKVALIGTELFCQKCANDDKSSQTQVSKESSEKNGVLSGSSPLLLTGTLQRPNEIQLQQNHINSPDSGHAGEEGTVNNETGTDNEDITDTSVGFLSPVSATSGYKSDISCDQDLLGKERFEQNTTQVPVVVTEDLTLGNDQRNYGLSETVQETRNGYRDFGKFYQTSFLDKPAGFQRGPSLYKTGWKGPQHFHRPDAKEFSYQRVRTDILQPNKSGKIQQTASVRVRTDPPYKPTKSQEPIRLAKLPDAQKTDSVRQMPIERDDFVAPPETAAVYPELLRGINLHRKFCDFIDGKDENKESDDENNENMVVDSRLEKKVEEISKITNSGTAQMILGELKKKKHATLDPRNSSRSASATVEPFQKIRFESSIFASPSRDLDRARPWRFDEPSEDTYRTCYSPIGPHIRKSRTLDNRKGCASAMAVKSSTLNPRYYATFNSEFRNGYTSDTTDGYYPSSYMYYHRRPESSTPVADRSCYTPQSDFEDYDPTTGLKVTRNFMNRLNVLTDGRLTPSPASKLTEGRLTPRPASKLRQSVSVGLFKDEEEAAKMFPYEKLCLDNPDRPIGLDANRLEQHLAKEEFERLFSQSKEAFMRLPEWKRNDLKQRVRLFDSTFAKSPVPIIG